MNRKSKRKRNPIGCLSLLVIVLAVGAVVAFQALSPLFRRTAVIQTGGMGNQHQAEAVIVRDEELTDAEGVTSILYFADEGDLVYKGNKIAEIYSSGYSQTEVNKLDNIRQQIRQYHQEVILTSYADPQLERLDADVLARAQEVKLLIQRRGKGSLLNLQRQLAAALSARQTYLRQKYPNDQRLSRLYTDESGQQKKIESWTISYIAQQQEIVSFYTDGYETLLRGETMDDLGPTEVRDILAGVQPERSATQRARTDVFRTIAPSGWHILLLSNAKDWNPVVGQNYKIQLEGFNDRVMDATVRSFSRLGGDLLVRMDIHGDVRDVINVRTTRAVVGELYVEGLQVPINALYQQNGVMGVVVTDGGGVFVPVNVLQSDHKIATIQPQQAGALYAGQKVRLF